MSMQIKRGDIFYVNLSGSIGYEEKGIRPVLILSSTTANQLNDTVVAVCMTRNVKPYKTKLLVEGSKLGMQGESAVLLNQIRTLDKQRLKKMIGHASPDVMVQVFDLMDMYFGRKTKEKGKGCEVVDARDNQDLSGLIKINYYSNRQTTSARDLWEFLNIGTEYAKWFSRMAEYGFSENTDFRVIVKNDENPLGGRPCTDHEITFDMAKEIAMIQRTEKGKQARLYFLDLEKQWNSPEAVMARALKMADRTIFKLKSKIEEDKPKVLFADSVTASSSSILVGDLAKLLKQNGIDTGEVRLWKWLRDNGYAIKEEGRSYNMPTQRSMDLKVMEVKEGSRIASEGESKITKTTLITGKGQVYFINRFLEKH